MANPASRQLVCQPATIKPRQSRRLCTAMAQPSHMRRQLLLRPASGPSHALQQQDLSKYRQRSPPARRLRLVGCFEVIYKTKLIFGQVTSTLVRTKTRTLPGTTIGEQVTYTTQLPAHTSYATVTKGTQTVISTLNVVTETVRTGQCSDLSCSWLIRCFAGYDSASSSHSNSHFARFNRNNHNPTSSEDQDCHCSWRN